MLNVHFTLLVTLYFRTVSVLMSWRYCRCKNHNSLPVLMYAVPALSLKSKQIDELNVCWNNVIRRLFNYNQSVKVVLAALDRLNISHLIMIS